MFKQPLTQIIQHVMSQNTWAAQELTRYSGQSVKFIMFPIQLTLSILEDGNLAIAGEGNVPQATVTIPPSVGLRLLANDESANHLVKIEGDIDLAATLSKVVRNASWDIEEDLSNVLGDVTAHQVTEWGKQAAQQVKAQSINLAEMVVEYWQEEKPIVAKKMHVEAFMSQVDQLREDVDRIEKRLEKLLKQVDAPQSNYKPQP